jgi:hypothetical protein
MNKNKMDFFCIGAQKSGTTSLHDILAQNPQIGLPLNKETHYFSHDDLYTNNLKDYFSHFPNDLTNRKVIGEIDPEYLCSKRAAKRIFENFGADLKFIVILRNPFDRAYSQYLMSKRRGFETLEFKEALAQEKERIKDSNGQLYYSYGTRSMYSSQIKEYFKLFKPSNFMFVRFEEDFIANKHETILKINQFLGLKEFDYDLSIESNVASVPKNKLIRDFINKPNFFRKVGKLFIASPQLRKDIITKLDLLNRKKVIYQTDSALKAELINNMFLMDIKELEQLVNLDFSSWYGKK